MNVVKHYILLERLAERVVNNETTLEDARDILDNEYNDWYTNTYLPKLLPKKIRNNLGEGLLYKGVCTRGLLQCINRLYNLCVTNDELSNKALAKMEEALENINDKTINNEQALIQLIDIYKDVIQLCDNYKIEIKDNYDKLMKLSAEERKKDYYKIGKNILIEEKYDGVLQMGKTVYDSAITYIDTFREKVVNNAKYLLKTLEDSRGEYYE